MRSSPTACSPSRAGRMARLGLDAPLVGRRDSLAQLEWALERATSERDCRLVTVVGGPGIGKSRLSTSSPHRSPDARRSSAADASPTARASRSGHWPRWSGRRRASTRARAPDESVARIQALLPPDPTPTPIAETIAHLTGLRETTGVVAEGAWAVRKLFATLAAERPLVVLLDDAHWAEDTLLEMIENLARHTESVPIVLLCTSRPELLERRPEWGHSAGAGPSTIVRLEPLDDAACDRLIAELLGESQSAAGRPRSRRRPSRGQSPLHRADDLDAHRRRESRSGRRRLGRRWATSTNITRPARHPCAARGAPGAARPG